MAISSPEGSRKEIIECLTILDDAKRFGWRDEDYKNINDKLLWVIQYLNCRDN
jgi:hypothetical protein